MTNLIKFKKLKNYLLLQIIGIIFAYIKTNFILFRQTDYLPQLLYFALVMVRLGASLFYFSLIPAIVIRLRRYRMKISRQENDVKMAKFMKRQNNFTKAVLFSCVYTFCMCLFFATFNWFQQLLLSLYFFDYFFYNYYLALIFCCNLKKKKL